MVFHFQQKKMGVTAGYSTFSMEALKTYVLTWGMFVSSPMKAAIHLGPNYLANLDVYKNTHFEDIQCLLNNTQNLTLECSSEILIVNTTESASPSWTRSVLSHDQVIQPTPGLTLVTHLFCFPDSRRMRQLKSRRRTDQPRQLVTLSMRPPLQPQLWVTSP